MCTTAFPIWPYLAQLDRQRARFGFDVCAVGLDAAPIAKGLEKRDTLGVTGYLRPSKPKGMLPQKAFRYDAELDAYRCPEGQIIPYATTDRTGYRHYKSDPSQCPDCPLLVSCTTNAKAQKTITRHVWADARERPFVDAKQLFGHRYARFRSRAKVQTQCLLAATAQNIKKIARATWKPQHQAG